MDKLFDITVCQLHRGFDHIVISYVLRVTKEQLYPAVPVADIKNLPAFVCADWCMTAVQRMRRQTLYIPNFDQYFKNKPPSRVRVSEVRIFARVEKGKDYFKQAK